MGIIGNIMLSGGNASSRPVLLPDTCLNRKQNKYTCTVCEEVCPEKILTRELTGELKWYRCTDCGLCVSACPSRCFIPSAQMQRVLTDTTHPGEAVVIACDREEELLKRKVLCLAGIPWELLAILTFYGDVVLYTGNCAGCENKAWYSRLQGNLEKLKSFLGEKVFGERVHLVGSGTWKAEMPEEEKEMTRREIFSKTGKSLKKTTFRAVLDRFPQLENSEKDTLTYRRILSQVVLKERERVLKDQEASGKHEGADSSLPVYSVPLPAYNTSCFGCSICERICPQKAIEVKAEEGGTRLILITPWKCTSCGLCARICPHDGLNGLRETTVPYLERLPLVRVKTESCEQCGTAIRPGSRPALCAVCAAKSRRKLRR